MAVNKATLDLITFYEGFIDHWYPDPAHGWKVPTAMYGHTNATGNPPLYSGTADRQTKFTKAQGRSTLTLDLKQYEQAVLKGVKVPLNANQFGALVSFTFNLGAGNFAKSTLLKKVNAKDWAGAAAEFSKWNKAAGKVLPGLTKRRAAEAKLFLTPVVTTMGDTEVEEHEVPIQQRQPDDPGVDPAAPVFEPSWWQKLIGALIDAFLNLLRRN